MDGFGNPPRVMDEGGACFGCWGVFIVLSLLRGRGERLKNEVFCKVSRLKYVFLFSL